MARLSYLIGLLTYYTRVDKNIMKPGFDTGADYCIIKPRFIQELTDYHGAGFQNENKFWYPRGRGFKTYLRMTLTYGLRQ